MQNWFWIDLEMTGLDYTQHHILEAAVIVTDAHLKVVDTWETTIQQPQRHLDLMDNWCIENHTKSGLLERCKTGVSESECEKKLISLAQQYFTNKEKIILAGNSVGQDRKFIDKYFPDFAKLLHYRMLDVSSWKVVFENMYGFKYKKQNKHRALDDIQESIGEFRTYLSYLDVSKIKPV